MKPREVLELHASLQREAHRAVRGDKSVAKSFAESGASSTSSSQMLLLGSGTPKHVEEKNQPVAEKIKQSTMLRAAIDGILELRMQKLTYLEGKLAAIEAIRRKNTRRNVAYWTETLVSAGKDFELKSEKASTIQQGWRAHRCRQKLRYVLMSVVRCPVCGQRCQIPKRHTKAWPGFCLSQRYRCWSCQKINTSSIHSVWTTYVGPESQFFSGGRINATTGAKSSTEKLASSNIRQRLHQTLISAGFDGDLEEAERKLLTFTEFWRYEDMENAVNGSVLSFARGVNMRTGSQLHDIESESNLKADSEETLEHLRNEQPGTLKTRLELEEEIERAKEEAAKAQEEALSSLKTAASARKESLILRFKMYAREIGLERVCLKNMRAAKWQSLVTLALNKQKMIATRTQLEEEIEMAKAKRDNILEQTNNLENDSPTSKPANQEQPVSKFPLNTLVLAGLPDWGDDKYPGVIRVVNGDSTYGVVFDVSMPSLFKYIVFTTCMCQEI